MFLIYKNLFFILSLICYSCLLFTKCFHNVSKPRFFRQFKIKQLKLTHVEFSITHLQMYSRFSSDSYLITGWRFLSRCGRSFALVVCTPRCLQQLKSVLLKIQSLFSFAEIEKINTKKATKDNTSEKKFLIVYKKL